MDGRERCGEFGRTGFGDKTMIVSSSFGIVYELLSHPGIAGAIALVVGLLSIGLFLQNTFSPRKEISTKQESGHKGERRVLVTPPPGDKSVYPARPRKHIASRWTNPNANRLPPS
jgi:hypothetical protein